jgi:hypothetical protein
MSEEDSLGFELARDLASVQKTLRENARIFDNEWMRKTLSRSGRVVIA